MAAPVFKTRTTRRTHERLVEATRREIAATGSFTAERVAARAGSSPATFYSYFPSKSDALAAAFAGVMQDLLTFCERELSIERLLETDLETRCHQLTEATIAFFHTNERVFRAALAAFPESRRMRNLYRDCEAASLEVHEGFVSLGQEAGQLRKGHPREISRGLLVLLQGLNNPSVLKTRSTDPLRQELARAIFSFLRP